jgi:multidrug efflux pump subunit AcrA (membrane-fusion protein)
VLKSDPISERYQTEIDYATSRLQKRYEHALKVRDAAQRQLDTAIRRREKKSRVAELQRQLDIREYELIEIAKLMQPGNRSRVAWRPVPVTHGQAI